MPCVTSVVCHVSI